MNEQDFIKYIRKIGFTHSFSNNNMFTKIDRYEYKRWKIDIRNNQFDFSDGFIWMEWLKFDHISVYDYLFKKELRSIKLKNILNGK